VAAARRRDLRFVFENSKTKNENKKNPEKKTRAAKRIEGDDVMIRVFSRASRKLQS